MEGWLIAQQAEMLALETEMQGMVALNQYRLSRDETIAYDDEAFQKVADGLRGIAACIMNNR